MDKLIERAKIVVEALPYIQKYAGKTFVIKYGGNAMVDNELKRTVMQDIVLLKFVGINPIIVHGGGPELTHWLAKVNKESSFVNGLRVTDAETVELAEMVFVGKINKELISLIHKHGGKGVGLSGKDGRLVVAEKRDHGKDVDLGFVGNVKKINVDVLETLVGAGYIPVISSIGEDELGQSYNINADTVAGAIASELKASKLILLTDVDGVKQDDKLLSKITIDQVAELKSNGTVTGGMIPKLDCAVNSLSAGVEKVHIINGQIQHALLLEVFTDHGIGSMVKKK